MVEKIRTIITQDAEVDDQNSLRHFLLYANEVELLGIIQTSSKFHWQGVEGAVKPEKTMNTDFDQYAEESGPFDEPYRWTGTDWMYRVADDYAQDYENLCRHAEGYPTPDYIRSIIKIGNIGYEGEMEKSSEGSELIKECILRQDNSPLYIQVWGGTNTIARALLDIERENCDRENWTELHRTISDRVILLACGEQDQTYRSYIAENWPDIMFVKTLQMMSYAYPWVVMPESESKDCLRSSFMKNEILREGCALTSRYCTWLDGNYYEGEQENSQFGTNPDIKNMWFGNLIEDMKPKPFDFLSEGDSPTYLSLFNWGFRTLEDFSLGGITGRYCKKVDEINSKGERLNLWDVVQDDFEDYFGNTAPAESMWPYVADIQRDFAARTDWARNSDCAKCEYPPELDILEGVNINAAAGVNIILNADIRPADYNPVIVTARLYREISSPCVSETQIVVNDSQIVIEIPDKAENSEKIHLIVRAQAQGKYKLARYRHVIITVK